MVRRIASQADQPGKNCLLTRRKCASMSVAAVLFGSQDRSRSKIWQTTSNIQHAQGNQSTTRAAALAMRMAASCFLVLRLRLASASFVAGAACFSRSLTPTEQRRNDFSRLYGETHGQTAPNRTPNRVNFADALAETNAGPQARLPKPPQTASQTA